MLRAPLERLRALMSQENNVLILTAVVVGVLAGVGAIALEELLRLVSNLLLGDREPTTSNLWRVGLAPAVGGLLAGPLVARAAREARGHGVPEVIEAVAFRGGRIRPRVSAVKTLASALTIGSGGSAGREGPIVQIGAALGSYIGQTFKMSEQRVRLLVGCGAAGGIAAAFNAPLAGVFFALEVILQRFTTRGFATVVISAVVSTAIWRSAFGNEPVIDVTLFGLENPVELLIYVGLGVAAAVVALVFVRVLSWTEDAFDALPIINDAKPALGGLILGGVGIATVMLIGEPLIFGTGLLGMDRALGNGFVWWALVILLVGKLIGTSLTLGSGGSGGVFAPSLFMGAMLGALVGQGANVLLPTATAPAGAYAMVGMAAVFAAAAQAPISAILILFEMTNDYLIMLPLMLSCIVSTSVYAVLQKDSIYLEKLRRKGLELTEGRERHLLERTPISRAIVEDVTALQLPVNLQEVRDRMRREGVETFLCVDEEGCFLGNLRIEDIEEELARGRGRAAEELVDTKVVPVVPDESLEDAFRKIAVRDLRIVPVIDAPESRVLIGAITRDSLTGAYWSALIEEKPRIED